MLCSLALLAFLDKAALVYLVFVYLVWHGVQTLHDRVVVCRKLFVLPFVLTLWSIVSLFAKKNPYDACIWAFFLAVGIFWGWQMVQNSPLWPRLLAQRGQGGEIHWLKRKIALPGGKSILILSLLAFAARYVFGGYYTDHPLVYCCMLMRIADCATAGMFAGIFWGRALCICRAVRPEQ